MHHGTEEHRCLLPSDQLGRHYAKPAVPVPNMPEPRTQDEHIPEGKQGELVWRDCCPAALCRLNVCPPGVPCC